MKIFAFREDTTGKNGLDFCFRGVVAGALLLWAAATSATVVAEGDSCGVSNSTRVLSACAHAGNGAVVCPLGEGRTLHLVVESRAPSVGDGCVAVCLGLLALEGDHWRTDYDERRTVAVAVVDEECWDAGREPCALEVTASEAVWELPAARALPSSETFWSCAQSDVAPLSGLRAGPASVRSEWLRGGLGNCTGLRALALDSLDLGAEVLALPPLPQLLSLDLAGFLYLPPEIFKATPTLERLSLRRCFLNGLPSGVFAAKRLRYLHVSDDQGYAFRVCADLSALENLEELSLTNNFAVDGSTLRALPSLPRLRVLDLSMCRVRFGPDDSFESSPFDKFPALEVILLSRNLMEHLGIGFLNELTLKVVDLSHNSFSEWPAVSGSDISVLDLSYNTLNTVVNLGKLNTTVQTLNLSMNNIAEWYDENVFSLPNTTEDDNDTQRCGGAWVEEVDLSLNLIVALSEPVMASLSHVTTVILRDNQLDCADCGTPRWARWMLESGHVAQAASLVCSAPPEDVRRPLAKARGFLAACEYPDPGSGGDVSGRALAVVGPLFGACAVLIASLAFAAFRYRAEVAYTLHLFRIRQERADDAAVPARRYLYDAFICYSGSDRPWVMHTLAPLLEAPPARYRLCLHDRDFALGSLIVDNIVKAIERSRRVVVVLSPHFVRSKEILVSAVV